MTEAYPFVFDSFELGSDRKTLLFRYATRVSGRDRMFQEEILLPDPIPTRVPEVLVRAFMQNLHLMLGISYWKMTCSPEIIIKPFFLTTQQAIFWNTLYTKGLGEFFYRNGLDFDGLVRFPSSEAGLVTSVEAAVEEKHLVGIAGGKDSLVTAKLLEKNKLPYTGIVFETGRPYPVIDEVIPLLHTSVIRVKRKIDGQLFELNSQGVYNGHIPISAIYAFLGTAAAVFYGYGYFIVSNERSANYGNINYRGMEINHQWSKSGEFEELFRQYVKTFLTPSVTYFSLLRPFNELQIMEQLVGYPDLLPYFSSCNKNFKVQGTMQKQKWCGECPKCAFVFVLLAAYLRKEKAVAVVGRNLFEDSSLLQTYRQLLGTVDFKPFECVGTPEEVRTAFAMINERKEFENTPIMDMFVREVLSRVGYSEKATQKSMGESDVSSLPLPFQKLFSPNP